MIVFKQIKLCQVLLVVIEMTQSFHRVYFRHFLYLWSKNRYHSHTEMKTEWKWNRLKWVNGNGARQHSTTEISLTSFIIAKSLINRAPYSSLSPWILQYGNRHGVERYNLTVFMLFDPQFHVHRDCNQMSKAPFPAVSIKWYKKSN